MSYHLQNEYVWIRWFYTPLLIPAMVFILWTRWDRSVSGVLQGMGYGIVQGMVGFGFMIRMGYGILQGMGYGIFAGNGRDHSSTLL